MNLSQQLAQGMEIPPPLDHGVSYFPIPGGQPRWSMMGQNFTFPGQLQFPLMMSPPPSPNYGPNEPAFMFPPSPNFGLNEQGTMTPPPSPNYGPNEPAFMFPPPSPNFGPNEPAFIFPPPSPNFGPNEPAFMFPPVPNYGLSEDGIMSPPLSPNYGPNEPAFMFPPSPNYVPNEPAFMFPSPLPNYRPEIVMMSPTPSSNYGFSELTIMSPPMSPTCGTSEPLNLSPPMSPTFGPIEPATMDPKPSYNGPNEPFILVMKYLLDCVTTFYLNGKELPYVINAWDPALLIRQSVNPKSYEYYVPPNVEETDYFGGQHEMWQIKLMQYFGKCRPDIWRMQAVPDFKKNPAEGWITFTVTTKLRFCCRSCFIPWTSKKGKTMFAFILNSGTRRGWIFMKMYGQVCMRKKCKDWSFQTPACYPEEIDRATHKLCEYISYIYYGIPLDPALFIEVEKSVRVGNPTSQHRKDLCQACQQGICEQGR